MSLDTANKRYPCDKRDGEARPCNCQPDIDVNKRPDLFWCNLQSKNVNLTICKDCNYRENKFGTPARDG